MFFPKLVKVTTMIMVLKNCHSFILLHFW